MEDGRAEIPLNVTVQGDVLVVIYHARSTLGGRLQAKVQAYTTVIRILTFILLILLYLIKKKNCSAQKTDFLMSKIFSRWHQ